MIVYFLLGSTVACLLVIAIYRLHVHPLSNVPGPRLAALTGLYEVFCVAWCSESYDEEIDRMHRAYGQFSLLPASQNGPPKDPLDDGN